MNHMHATRDLLFNRYSLMFVISIHCNIVNTCQWLFLHFHIQVYSELYHSLRITTCPNL